MTPPRVLVVQISQRSKFSQVENEYTLLCECKVIIAQKREKIEMSRMITYDADQWSSDAPAEFEPTSWVVANHVFETVVEAIHSKTPGNGNAFEEDKPQEDQVATGVAVEQLEHVHPALLCRGREEKIILSLSLFIIQCQLKRGQSKT